ncbi:asparagine synthase (glutamine-hydrolyzing) [Streptomyces sp. NPDC052020]|uniref:asparagine synthase (glutamine-hydrolyzing) n=1 Tax=Streptomyces sp. NPDC052020 TaxID=3155677 RepID=UPI00341B7058
MCGIAGWIAYDADLTGHRERKTAAAMTATLRCRGPDGAGLWVGPHAALGHRRLAVVGIEGGGQPMTVSHGGRPPAVVAHSGEIHNHRELRAELEHRGHRFRTTSDTEVVLRAYLTWGEDFTTRLNGMYAIALWDTRTEQLLLVRDRMGVKPLYYRPTGGGVVFGSEPKAVLAHPRMRPVVDTDGLRELLAATLTPGHGIYAGLRQVRPGHTVRVRRQGVTEHRYWALRAREHTDDLPATVATVRTLLEDIVARQLDADVPVCTLLSGGLDSSAVTALATRVLRDRGRGPLRSFAVDFPGHSGDHRPDQLRPTPDGPYVHALAAHTGCRHTDVVLHPATLTDPGHRHAVLRARDLPTSKGDTNTSLLLLCREVRAHCPVALTGDCADELFGGYRSFHDPRTVAAPAFPWTTARGPDGRNGALLDPALLDPGLRTALDLRGYQHDRYREALAAVSHPDRPTTPGERRMREITHLELTRRAQAMLDRADRLGMAAGLEIRVPFCDHRLVEYVYGTPWAMKTSDGREKSLLRAAVRDLLPAAVADRAKCPYPAVQDPGYTRALLADLTRTLDDPAAPVRPLLDLAAARRLADPATPAPRARPNAETILALDAWLRTYHVELGI